MPRKGLSPLIATVLLIAFTVSIGAILMTWVSSLTKESTGEIGNKSSSIIDCNVADITIDDVYIDLRANISRVIVRNSGLTTVEVTDAILMSITGENATPVNGSLPITNFSSGKVANIEFNITNVITACSNFSKVIVSTNCAGKKDIFDGTPKCFS